MLVVQEILDREVIGMVTLYGGALICVLLIILIEFDQ